MIDEIERLRTEIRAAFAWRPRPEDDRPAGPVCAGDESEEVASFFRGKDWRGIQWDSILGSELDSNSFLYFMSVEAFVYFLPAFLIESLDGDAFFDLGEPLAVGLMPLPGDPKHPGVAAARNRLSRIVSLLTAEEKRAVTDVLRYLAREHEKRDSAGLNVAQAALDSYWAGLSGSR